MVCLSKHHYIPSAKDLRMLAANWLAALYSDHIPTIDRQRWDTPSSPDFPWHETGLKLFRSNSESIVLGFVSVYQ
jgi:hypothetical protein